MFKTFRSKRFRANCLHVKSCYLGKIRITFQHVVCWKFTQSAKRWRHYDLYIYLKALWPHKMPLNIQSSFEIFIPQHHWGVQLILAYSWARPAILVVGKGRGGIFLFLLFLHFHSCSTFFPVPLFHLLYSLLSLFSLSLGDDTKWLSRVDVSLNPNTINQSYLNNCLFCTHLWSSALMIKCIV